jgi:hypothetical protein
MEFVVPVASWQKAGHRYRVTLSDIGDQCDCSDFYWRHINRGDEEHLCKHIAAARQLLVDGIPAPKPRRRRTPRSVAQGALAA